MAWNPEYNQQFLFPPEQSLTQFPQKPYLGKVCSLPHRDLYPPKCFTFISEAEI